MNEINFFEQNKRKIELNLDLDFKYKLYILPAVLVILLLIFIFSLVSVNRKIVDLQAESEKLTLQKTKLEFPNKVAGAKPNSELEIKKQTVQAIENIENYDKISSKNLDVINASIPQSLFLDTLELNDQDVVITGYAKSSNIIASFQNNLETSEEFSDVFVSDITNQLGNYNFTLTAKIGVN